MDKKNLNLLANVTINTSHYKNISFHINGVVERKYMLLHVNKPIPNPIINRPVLQPIINRSVLQPVNKPVLQPVNRPVLQPINIPVLQPVNRPVLQPVNKSVLRPINRILIRKTTVKKPVQTKKSIVLSRNRYDRIRFHLHRKLLKVPYSILWDITN